MENIRITQLPKIQQAAQQFIEQIKEPAVIAFLGEMGAGKTTFIKAICTELGVIDTVNSPTFAIVNDYETEDGSNIYHFDLYRMEKAEEVLDIGFEDYLYSGKWCFIEWPEIAEKYLPENVIKVKIEEIEKGERLVSFIDSESK